MVVRHPSEHNVILGLTNLLKFGAVSSKIHGIVKFNTSHGPGTILATPPRELKCYEIMQPRDISAGAKRPRPDSSNGGKVINREYPNQQVNAGKTLPVKTRKALVQLL